MRKWYGGANVAVYSTLSYCQPWQHPIWVPAETSSHSAIVNMPGKAVVDGQILACNTHVKDPDGILDWTPAWPRPGCCRLLETYHRMEDLTLCLSFFDCDCKNTSLKIKKKNGVDPKQFKASSLVFTVNRLSVLVMNELRTLSLFKHIPKL